MPIRIPRSKISTHAAQRRPTLSPGAAAQPYRAGADMFKALAGGISKYSAIEKKESFRKDENLLRENNPDVILEESLITELDPNVYNDDRSTNGDGTIAKFEDIYSDFETYVEKSFANAIAEVEGMNFENPESRDHALSLLKGGINKFKSNLPMRKAEYGLKLDEYKSDYVDNILSVMGQEENIVGPQRDLTITIGELQTVSDTILAEDQKATALSNIETFISNHFKSMLGSTQGRLDFLIAATEGFENETMNSKAQELMGPALLAVGRGLGPIGSSASNAGNTGFFYTERDTITKAERLRDLLLLKKDTANAQVVSGSIAQAEAGNIVATRTPGLLTALGDDEVTTGIVIDMGTVLNGTDSTVIASNLEAKKFFEEGFLNNPIKVWKTAQFFNSLNQLLPENVSTALEKFLEKDIHDTQLDKMVFERIVGLMSKPETPFLKGMDERRDYYLNWKKLRDKGIAITWASYKAMPPNKVVDLLDIKYTPAGFSMATIDPDNKSDLSEKSAAEFSEHIDEYLIEWGGIEPANTWPGFVNNPFSPLHFLSGFKSISIKNEKGFFAGPTNENDYYFPEANKFEMQTLFQNIVGVTFQQIRQTNTEITDTAVMQEAHRQAWEIFGNSISIDTTGVPGDDFRTLLVHKIGSQDYQIIQQNGIAVSGGRYVTAAMEEAITQAEIPLAHKNTPHEFRRLALENSILKKDVLGNYAIYMNNPNDEKESGFIINKNTGLPLLMNVQNVANFSLSPTYLASSREIKALVEGRERVDTNLFLQKEATAANLSDIVLGPVGQDVEEALSESDSVTPSQIQVIENFIKYGGIKDAQGIPVMGAGSIPFTENAMSEIVGIPGYEDLSDDRKHFILQKAVSSARQRMNEDSFLHNPITRGYYMDEVKTRHEAAKAAQDRQHGSESRIVDWTTQDSKDALSAAKTRFWIDVDRKSGAEKAQLFRDLRESVVPFRVDSVFVGDYTLDAMAARAITGRVRGTKWTRDAAGPSSAIKVAQSIQKVFKERKKRPVLLESLNISGRESEVPPEFYDLYGAPYTNDPKAYSADNLMARGQKEDLTGEPWDELRVIYNTLGSKPTAKKVTESIYSLTEGWSEPIDYYDYVRFELATRFAEPEAKIIFAMNDQMFAKFLGKVLFVPPPEESWLIPGLLSPGKPIKKRQKRTFDYPYKPDPGPPSGTYAGKLGAALQAEEDRKKKDEK